jgi:hypothetical protein
VCFSGPLGCRNFRSANFHPSERSARLSIDNRCTFCLSTSDISHLVALVGPARTKDLIFTARLLEAPETLSLGLLNEVVCDVATLQRRANDGLNRVNY